MFTVAYCELYRAGYRCYFCVFTLVFCSLLKAMPVPTAIHTPLPGTETMGTNQKNPQCKPVPSDGNTPRLVVLHGTSTRQA
jgi:hypothetical protein